MIGVAIAIAARDADQTPAAVVRDAGIAHVAVADANVALDARVEVVATVIADAQLLPAANDPWADHAPSARIDAGSPPPDAAPRVDAGIRRVLTPQQIQAQLQSLPQIMKQQCRTMTSSAMIDSLPASLIVTCWCYLGDRTRALEVYGRLSSDTVKRQARDECRRAGMTVP